MPRFAVALAVAAVAVGLTACSRAPSNTVTGAVLALPAGDYGPLSWGSSGLYTGYESSAKDTFTATLDRIDPLTDQIANVGPPPLARCTATDYRPALSMLTVLSSSSGTVRWSWERRWAPSPPTV